MSSAATKASKEGIDRDSGLTFQHLDGNSSDVIGSQTVGRGLHNLPEGSGTQNRTYRETRDAFRMDVAIKVIRLQEKSVFV